MGRYRAYEWNKMKTPTRILVGGPEVTSAFVLMGLALARQGDAARLGGCVNCVAHLPSPSDERSAIAQS